MPLFPDLGKGSPLKTYLPPSNAADLLVGPNRDPAKRAISSVGPPGPAAGDSGAQKRPTLEQRIMGSVVSPNVQKQAVGENPEVVVLRLRNRGAPVCPRGRVLRTNQKVAGELRLFSTRMRTRHYLPRSAGSCAAVVSPVDRQRVPRGGRAQLVAAARSGWLVLTTSSWADGTQLAASLSWLQPSLRLLAGSRGGLSSSSLGVLGMVPAPLWAFSICKTHGLQVCL